MIPMSTTFKHASRAALLAIALSGGSMAVPALTSQAVAQEPAFNFHLDLGSGAMQFGTESFRGRDRERGRNWDRHDHRRSCLTDRQVRRGIADYGFRDVEIRRDLGRDRVEVRGDWRRSTYSMRVDRCTGEVDRVERLRRGRPDNGFGLHFNFRN